MERLENKIESVPPEFFVLDKFDNIDIISSPQRDNVIFW